MLGGRGKTKLTQLSTSLEAIATILTTLKVITSSIKSLAALSEGTEHENGEPRKPSRLGIHKWVLLAGAFVGIITIAYLENVVANIIRKRDERERRETEEKKVETVYVTK